MVWEITFIPSWKYVSKKGEWDYIKKKENNVLIICIYVDDTIFMGSLTEKIYAFINCTPIHVKNNTKLTSFMKLIRIE